ncbi:MAG: peptide-methionine (S)-S-oxide reductase MsrA [Candidatus Saccharimonadales bacterium]
MRRTAILAAGCFWGVQYYFDQVPGIIETTVGYIGGELPSPTYEQVCAGGTGHAEAVKIIFDPVKVSFPTLLKHFFRMHDPTQINRQGPDVGEQYRSAIFYLDEKQKAQVEEVVKKLNNSGQFNKKILTMLEPAGKFWPAEDYHQKYTERTGLGMCHIDYAAI